MLRDSILSSQSRKFVSGAQWSLVSFGEKLVLPVFLLIKNEGGVARIGTARCFLPLRGQGERHGSISMNTL